MCYLGMDVKVDRVNKMFGHTDGLDKIDGIIVSSKIYCIVQGAMFDGDVGSSEH